MKKTESKQLLQSLKAISDENRLSIMFCLGSGEKCVCQIYKHLNLPQNLISHHLSVLKKGGFIISKKQGRWVHYSINSKAIGSLCLILKELRLNKKCC